MNKLFDLRFVIGIFFLIIGILLLGYGLFSSRTMEVNKWCGILFISFGAFMLIFSFRKKVEDSGDKK